MTEISVEAAVAPPFPCLEFHGLIPFSKEGIGVGQTTYGSGRLGVVLNHFGGLSKIFHHGICPEQASRVLYEADPSSAYRRLFRHQVVVEGAAYNFEFRDTLHFPFGYASHFSIPDKGLEFRHRLTLAPEALIFSAEVLANPRHLRLIQRIEHHQQSAKSLHGTVARSVSPWEKCSALGGWQQSFFDRMEDEAWESLVQTVGRRPNSVNLPCLDCGEREGARVVALFGASGEWTKRETHNRRVYFSGEEFIDGSSACALLFATKKEGWEKVAAELRETMVSYPGKAEDAYRAGLRALPLVESGNPAFDSCFAQVIPTVDCLRPADVSGGLRANSTNYWVWGWDSLLSADVHLLAGDGAFFQDMLRLYRGTAHPEFGYGHMFTSGMKVRLVQAHSAQSLYPVQLYNYFCHTQDVSGTLDFYPFAKSILERNVNSVNERGLGEGPTLFPDYPEFAGHNGCDISVFNNSLLYQGARSMEALANLAGDSSTAEASRNLARTIEAWFFKTFWDENQGYFVDSVESGSYAMRRSYPAHALLWQSNWLNDLVGDSLARCGQFQASHHLSHRGFLMYPRWDRSFDADGNQMAQVWQTHDVFVTRCQAAADNQEVLEGWIAQCAWFWEQLTYIEGYSCQTVNDSGTLDLPGAKQVFGAKSIWMAALTGLGGFSFDAGGITLGEGLARPLKFSRLLFRGNLMNFTLSGRGRHPASLVVNGRPVPGTCKIPLEILHGAKDVSFKRSVEPPPHPAILDFPGGILHSIEIVGANLKARVSGLGHVHLWFSSPRLPRVALNGTELECTYNQNSATGRMLLPLTSQISTLDISLAD